MVARWSGVWVAIVTPFYKDEVDEQSLRRLIQRLLDAGINGLCPCGTTGEGSSLDDKEFEKVLSIALETVKGRIPVVPGTGTNQTRSTIQRTERAKNLGASGALVVTPYYVKPTQEGLLRHYREISDHVDLPLMLYNVPGRTAVSIQPMTVETLVRESRIKAIKECASLEQATLLLRDLGDRLDVFLGEDGLMFPFFKEGGHGVVSVVANLFPKQVVELHRAAKKGQIEKAEEIFHELQDIIHLLFLESNPIPVKYALHYLGWMEDEIRSPLSKASPSLQEKLRSNSLVIREKES